MNLIISKTREKLEGVTELIENVAEFQQIKKNKQFLFDWTKEQKNQVFKIRLEEQEEILGLISIIDFPTELRIHINLIEVAKSHRGKNKPILNIVGCLIAFTCKQAFRQKYDGFVSLVPKTQLIDYYQNSYGFILMGTQMAVYGETASSLIQKYIGDEEI